MSISDMPYPPVLRGQIRHIVLAEKYPAAGGLQQTADQVQSSALAAPTGGLGWYSRTTLSIPI